MPLTSNSDVFASFHEKGFNRIIHHVMLQRPSLFNYATENLINSSRYCETIKYHPAVTQYQNPIATEVPVLPILGYDGSFGMNYCFQLTDLKIDFHPGNIIELPPELKPPLKKQQIALSGNVSIGLGCPDNRLVEKLIPTIKELEKGKSKDKSEKVPFSLDKMICFCTGLTAVMEIVRTDNSVEFRLVGIELSDLKPNGLENALECYISTLLRLTILPKLRFALEDLTFKLGDFATVSPALAPDEVPYNPSVGNDQLSVFFNLS